MVGFYDHNCCGYCASFAMSVSITQIRKLLYTIITNNQLMGCIPRECFHHEYHQVSDRHIIQINKNKSKRVRVDFCFFIITPNYKNKPQLVTKYLYEKLQLVALNRFVNFRKLISMDYYEQAESIKETCSGDPAYDSFFLPIRQVNELYLYKISCLS